MEILGDILHDKAEHLTSQEYVSAMNALRDIHASSSLPEEEDTYFLLFLYVEQDSMIRDNPSYDHDECCRTASRIMNVVTQVPAKSDVQAAVVICLFQFLFKNGNIFERSPPFLQTTLNKLDYFAMHNANEFIQINRLNQLHEWRAELAKRIG